VTGLRIDHVDGLYNPAEYLEQLQAWARKELEAIPESAERPLFVVAEKILGLEEAIPTNWPVYGTTGYDFLGLLNMAFIDRANERFFDNTYERFVPNGESFEELAYRCKQLIMQASMASELNVLGHHLNQLSERDRRSRDFTLNSLTHAIQEIIACFPVYRTYITGDPNGILGRDQSFIWQAVTKAKRRNPAVSGLVFDFVRDLLLKSSNIAEPTHEERLKFVGKFQQTTSPVTAKGIEDTAFYRFNRFVSLNEVGSDPQQFGLTPSQFHQKMKSRLEHWPASLSPTSTHDTKRGEDVRARLNVLSELPKQWKDHVLRWKKLNRAAKTKIDGELVPGPNEEYLLYQTLLGAWPLEHMNEEDYARFAERIQAYMNKAVREAKEHTSWISPDLQYEEAVRQFVASLLDRSQPNAFLEDFLSFEEEIAQYGLYNSMSQLLMKLAAPGVPDFYQGTELWDFSLVDPDNRQPVDFVARMKILGELRKVTETEADHLALVQELFSQRADGRIKLYLTREALRYRREHGPLFQQGDYVPLEGVGEKADHVFTFARTLGKKSIVVVVPRFLTRVISDAHTPPLGEGVWKDTWLVLPAWREETAVRNVFTGALLRTETRGDRQALPVGETLRHCPVAWLERVT
jgi:(1->4)-alpha-D-glucan 1-alpha-D-glucosylmutase